MQTTKPIDSIFVELKFRPMPVVSVVLLFWVRGVLPAKRAILRTTALLLGFALRYLSLVRARFPA